MALGIRAGAFANAGFPIIAVEKKPRQGNLMSLLEAGMNDAQHSGSRQTWKNWLIAILLCIAVGEFVLLARASAPGPRSQPPAPTTAQAPAPAQAPVPQNLDAVRVAGTAAGSRTRPLSPGRL